MVLSYTNDSTRFSTFKLPIIMPERIAIIKPLIIYIRAIFHPKRPKSKTMATSFIIGEETRKEKVVPKGTPAWIKPKNKGMAEQEQNGVIIPNREARIFPTYLFLRERIDRIFSGGRYERIIETIKIITAKRIKILIVSKIKKFIVEASNVFGAIPKIVYVSQSANNCSG